MTDTPASDRPHRRRNALTGDHILVSPHRALRPWQGQQEVTDHSTGAPHDPDCHLCPGNRRSSGLANPEYPGCYVFDNDFPALLTAADESSGGGHPLLQSEPAAGCCRVVCFSPRHDLTLAEMAEQEIVAVIDTWASQYRELAANHRWVQLFENKGSMMGCSSPHPHGQIWAVDTLPTEALRERAQQHQYWQDNGRRLLLDYAELEVEQQERLVAINDDWLVVVPYWAGWPFETLLLPRFAVARIDQLSTGQRASLAVILKQLLVRYDNLFNTSFPYSMGWHNTPGTTANTADEHEYWQLHAHFYPPLLRSATVRKFMVGFELLAEAQRDLTPEQAAQRLREVPSTHYRQRPGG